MADEINDPDIIHMQEKIKVLQNKVHPFSKKEEGGSSSFLPKLKFKRVYLYVGIPIIIAIVLLVLKPKFITDEKVNDEGEAYQSIQMKKVLMWTLILGGVLDVALFGYFYKNNNTISKDLSN
jgi:hypothetical protein